MTVQLNVPVPDDLMEWLAADAGRNLRTPEGQALWYLRNARGQGRLGRDDEARQVLAAELRKLHKDAGVPTFRVIAERIRQQGANVSLSTIHGTIRGSQLSPSWVVVESIVTALGGDAGHFRGLWVQARSGRLQPGADS